MSENELVSQTEECLAELPFSLMTTEMVERIWQAGFYEEDGDESEISIQDVKPYLNAMLNFLQCCHRWINDDQDRQKERIDFWIVLKNSGISVKVLLTFLSTIIRFHSKTNIENMNNLAAVLAANIYSALINVHGSRAYKVFQPALIQSAMNLLKYWPGLKNLTAKKSKKKSRVKGSRKRKIDEDFSDGNDDLMDTDSNSQDVEYAQSDAVVHFSYSSQDLMIALLQTIDKALAGTNVSLKDFQECFNGTLHSLIELTRLPDRNMSKTFDWILHNSSPHTETVTNLIFKALSRLILPQHGDPKENINKVSNRIFGLDLIQCMLERFAVIVDGLQDNPQDFTASSLLRIIISRCLDKASSVRSKALSAVAACARLECRVVSEAICEAAVSKITVVTKIVDESHEVTERTTARFGGPTSKVNLLDVVKRRMGDEKPGVRKCAIQALESLLSLDLQSMRSEQDFSTICDRCRDVSVSVRKQAMLSSTCLLERCLGNEIYRRFYFERACSQWCIGGKISANDVNRLFRQDFDEFKQTSWWLISVTASYITSFNPTLVADFWLDNDDFFGRDDILHCYVLQTISNVANRLPVEKYQLVYSKLQRELQKCRWTPNLISAGITVIHKFSESEMGISKIEIKQWSKAIMQECCKHICRISETRSLEASALDNAINRIFLIGEISMVIPDSVPSAIFSVLQKIVQDNSFSVPHCLRAHAVITLGKLCLQNEELAKNCVSTLAQCLDSSKDGALRNNIIVVMCDLCKRYATLIDAYVLNILACLRDSESLIRKQTLTLVTRLLQEDFLKLRGNTFYCIVVALVDHDSDVRNIAEFCLSNLILSRNPSIFMNNFIECIFSLNDCASHPDYNRIQYRERERKLFSIKGDNGTQRSRRQRIYEFLLSHMPDEQKFHLNAKICQEVLGAFVDETMQLNEMTFNVLKDTFTILRSKEIKLSSMKNNDVNDLLDEGDLAGAAIATAKSKILTQVTRKNTIENIVPIIVAVKKQNTSISTPERTNHPNTSINATPRLSARRHNNSFNTPALTPARVRCINRMNNTNSDQLQKTPVTSRRSQEYSSDAVDIPKENERAISTPCGQVSQVSFGTVMSSSMATNKSPMPTKIPLRLYNKEQPIKEQTSNESTDVVYLYSPEQPLPKPRKWNVRQ
ncbi:uncharacterized protein TRIADDRAFT_51986 [Trichoplax adhaerens]|uniref:Condensin complex subunit 1 C-terminal domain-containing protein n=1 Tax=Trichoplax adhaerens TaxID=10228 RepID=B3RLF3_TRIAD|nr:hypothetical protein TRIADDRAFT_51986 [Trichoplax adhaerens]EDV29533.1 hypothetical protein TRIADDRAFT_51986 [Trichoplax adhaerens]|eukprot:XP_002108735.1 hypothetical protein TRIADDRAFT_51986 [Trichoplax adhaerens]